MSDDLLAGRYRRIRRLGSGATSDVWLAEDTVLDRAVAVKKVRTDGGNEFAPLGTARMTREARIAARLNHPHAVAVYDFIFEDGVPFLIMEYVEGETLSQRIRRLGARGTSEVARLGREVADALAAAHAIGIVHRDIKPANILINGHGSAKLADFGVARRAEDAPLTDAGHMIGTVAYMAPETARSGFADAASDVWSLGATLYAAVEGRSPYDSGTADQNTTSILLRLVSEPVPDPQHAGDLTPLLKAMLTHDPTARPTARNAATALAGLAAPIDQAPVSVAPREDSATPPLVAPLSLITAAPPAEPDALPSVSEADKTRRRIPLRPPTPSVEPAPSGTPPEPPPAPMPAHTDPSAANRTTPPPAREDRGPLATVAPRRRRRLLIAVFVALVVVGAVVAALLATNGSSQGNPAAETSRGQRSSVVAPSKQPIGTVQTLRVGRSPQWVTISPDGSTMYVATTAKGTSKEASVDVMSLPSGKLTHAIPLPGDPNAEAMTPDGSQLWVSINGSPGTVVVIDLTTDSVAATIPTSGTPWGIAFSNDGRNAVVAIYSRHEVDIFDTANREVLSRVALAGSPVAAAASPDQRHVFVTVYGPGASPGSVAMIDVSTPALVETIPVGAEPLGIAVAPNESRVYVTNFEDNTVSILHRQPMATTGSSPVKYSILKTLAIGQAPNGVVVAPNSLKVYVAEEGAGTIAIINAGNEFVSNFRAGKGPTGIAVSKDGHRVYAANPGSATITVLAQ